MLHISDEVKRILDLKDKSGSLRPTIRVEFDKYVYNPDMPVSIDYKEVQYMGQGTYVTSNANISSSAVMASPLKGVAIEDLDVSMEFNQKYSAAVGNVPDSQKGVTTFVYAGGPHQGTDLRAEAGDKVTAVANGKVIAVVTKQSTTQYVVIEHETDKINTLYMHIRDIIVQVGDNVIQGQEIGEITSLSTGDHLHMEVISGRYDPRYFQGNSREDPMKYLRDKAKIINTPVMTYVYETYGIINTNNTVARLSANTGSTIVGQYNKGDSVRVLSKDGDFYKVNSPIEGYIHHKYLDVEFNEGEAVGDRGGYNPTYQEIINYICMYANSIGLPSVLGLATAWKESEMTHFIDNGSAYYCSAPNTDGSKDWGIMQINDSAHASEFPRVLDWQENIKYGLDYLNEKYIEAKRRGETDPYRSAYSAYNTGSDYDRYRTENDARDTGFFTILNTQPWNLKVPSAGAASKYGTAASNSTVSGIGTPIKEQPNESAKTIELINHGYILEEYKKEGDWFKVRLQDGRFGYIHKMYYSQTNFPVSVDYEIKKMMQEDFSGGMPTGYYQDKGKAWAIKNNALNIAGNGEQNSIFFTTKFMQTAGRLNLSVKYDLGPNCYFLIYIDNRLVFSGSGNVNTYTDLSFNLGSGNHTIKFERTKSSGVNEISVDSIRVYQFVMKPERVTNKDFLAAKLTSYTPRVFAVDGDVVNVHRSPSDSSEVFSQIDRGSICYVEDIQGDWVKIKFVDGAVGFVEKRLGVINNGTDIFRTMEVHSGGFVYDRTIVAEGVISATIDCRFDMRAAEANIVLENNKGQKSPDFRVSNFPMENFKKSDYADYYGDHVIGLLSENTPVRIYLGYGNHLVRRFTGLIDTVNVDGVGGTISIKCTDMMKKVTQYYTEKPLQYPPDSSRTADGKLIAWIASSVIKDLVTRAGMTSWKVTKEDLEYVDTVIEETYIPDIAPKNGLAIRYNENSEPEIVDISSLQDGYMYKSPATVAVKIDTGTSIGDFIDSKCQELNFWQRCDQFGTYKCTSIKYDLDPQFTFKDSENITTLNKTFDYSIIRNHIVISDSVEEEHFFDRALWIMSKGNMKTCKVVAEWAKEYGQKFIMAQKLLTDIKIACTTIQAEVEGNPYLELLDNIGIEHMSSATCDSYIIKGMTDNWHVDNGYATTLNLAYIRRL